MQILDCVRSGDRNEWMGSGLLLLSAFADISSRLPIRVHTLGASGSRFWLLLLARILDCYYRITIYTETTVHHCGSHWYKWTRVGARQRPDRSTPNLGSAADASYNTIPG